MKVLITGGAGYIGSTLTRLLLDEGYDVIILDRLFFGEEPLKGIEDRINIVRDDIRWFDPKLLEGVDAVFDLASLSNDPSGELDPNKTLEINYEGRLRVASLAKKRGVKRYVLASSCSVYGSQEALLDEESRPNPLTTYAKANYLAEKGVLPLADKGFTVAVLRLATAYGLSHRMRFDLAVNGMVRALYLDGKLKVMRDGRQWRPFVHVKDASRAFITTLEADQELVNSQIFNVGSDEQNMQIFPLAKMVAEACSQGFVYEWYGDPDKRNYKVSFKKIKETLRFKPTFTIKDGAREIWDALKEGGLDPNDPRTITLRWYKYLLENPEARPEVLINGRVL